MPLLLFIPQQSSSAFLYSCVKPKRQFKRSKTSLNWVTLSGALQTKTNCCHLDLA
jgi:hypothetical protein